MVLARTTVASQVMLENDASSVIHSTVSIANGYVSECVVCVVTGISLSS